MAQAERYSLETPENIELDFELAGIGSRSCAILIDWAIMSAVAALSMLLLLLISVGVWTGPIDNVRDSFNSLPVWATAIILGLLISLFTGGYFVLFEWLMHGQTPGKRAMKIRVMHDDGTPVTASDILVRNIIRLVDFLPAFFFTGLCVMFVHPLHKRLGDLAAGTIVVKEGQLDYRARADRKYKMAEPIKSPVNRELTPEERHFLTGFLNRREELLPAARQQLAEITAKPLFEKYGGHFGSAESYLERLFEGRHHES